MGGRFRCYVQESGRIDSVQSVSKGDEGGALREEHEQAIQTLEQVRVSVGFEEL
jgi:hypothetical protein